MHGRDSDISRGYLYGGWPNRWRYGSSAHHCLTVYLSLDAMDISNTKDEVEEVRMEDGDTLRSGRGEKHHMEVDGEG